MRGSLLHRGAAIAFTLQVASAQSHEAAHSNELPIPRAGDFGFSAAPHAKSYLYDLRSCLKTRNAVTAHFVRDEGTKALSTTRILGCHQELSDRRWFLKLDIADDVGVDIFERPLVYPSAKWDAYRSSGKTLDLSPTPPSGLENNSATGWKTHLGLAPPEITTKLGIPLSVAQRGIIFAANYHF